MASRILDSTRQYPATGRATAVSDRERASWMPVVSAADGMAVVGLLVLTSMLVAATWGTWGDFGADTGYDLLAGARLTNGELPYRDFVYYYGPLAPALVALSFRVGGVGIGSAVALGLMLAVGAIAMTYALARLVLLRPLGAFLVAAITAPVVLGPKAFNFVLPHTFSAPLGVCTALGFLLGVAVYALSSQRRWLVIAGICAGLAALTRPEFLMGVMAAAAIWLVLRAFCSIGGWREAATFAAPAALIPAVTYGLLLTVVSPHRLVFENLYPVETLKAAGNVILRSNAPLTLTSLFEIGWKTVLYLTGTLILVLFGRVLARPGYLRALALALTVVVGIAAVVLLVQRPETVRFGLKFVYGWIPVGAALSVCVLLWRFLWRRDVWSPLTQLELVGSVVLAALALKTYAVFFLYSHVAQLGAYAAPFAAILIGRLHLGVLPRASHILSVLWLAFLAIAGVGLTWKDARSESGAVSGPGGTMYVIPSDAPVYQGAISTILDRTAARESILIAPQLTSLYVLTDRRNPLPHLSLLPGALPTEAGERAAISRLEAANVRFAVIDRRDFGIYGHSHFGASFQRLLASWIREKFVHLKTLGDETPGSTTLDIWVRRAS